MTDQTQLPIQWPIKLEPIIVPKTAKYRLLRVLSSIYCNSSGWLFADFSYQTTKGRAKSERCRIFDHLFVYPVFPKYLIAQIEVKLVEYYRGNILRVYELDECKRRRDTHLKHFNPSDLDKFISEMERRLGA